MLRSNINCEAAMAGASEPESDQDLDHPDLHTSHCDNSDNEYEPFLSMIDANSPSPASLPLNVALVTESLVLPPSASPSPISPPQSPIPPTSLPPSEALSPPKIVANSRTCLKVTLHNSGVEPQLEDQNQSETLSEKASTY